MALTAERSMHESALSQVDVERNGLIQTRLADQIQTGRYNQAILQAAKDGASVDAISEVAGLPPSEIRTIIERGSRLADLNAQIGN